MALNDVLMLIALEIMNGDGEYPKSVSVAVIMILHSEGDTNTEVLELVVHDRSAIKIFA